MTPTQRQWLPQFLYRNLPQYLTSLTFTLQWSLDFLDHSKRLLLIWEWLAQGEATAFGAVVVLQGKNVDFFGVTTWYFFAETGQFRRVFLDRLDRSVELSLLKNKIGLSFRGTWQSLPRKRCTKRPFAQMPGDLKISPMDMTNPPNHQRVAKDQAAGARSKRSKDKQAGRVETFFFYGCRWFLKFETLNIFKLSTCWEFVRMKCEMERMGSEVAASLR